MPGVEAAFPTALRETALAAGRLMPAAPFDPNGSFVAYCYYRHSYRRDEYPGFALISSLRRAAADEWLG